jgi:hypothetical protein
VRLSKSTVETIPAASLLMPAGTAIQPSDIYRIYFHGPAYQVLEKAWWDGHRMIGLFAKNLPNNHTPSDLPTLMSPRLIELCFQTAGLSEIGTQNRMGLPHHVHSVTSLSSSEPLETPLYAVVTPDSSRGTFDAEVIDSKGRRYVQLIGYRTIAIPTALNPEQVEPLRAALSPAPVAA